MTRTKFSVLVKGAYSPEVSWCLFRVVARKIAEIVLSEERFKQCA